MKQKWETFNQAIRQKLLRAAGLDDVEEFDD
jgi:hypothetical protein